MVARNEIGVIIKPEHNNSSNLWGTVKEMIDVRNKFPTRMIACNGEIITSMKNIANF